MKMIYYRGLNCYLSSLISIADELGLNFVKAYDTLWSETEFSLSQGIYTSKRVIPNLHEIGLVTKIHINGQVYPEGSMFLICMDFFHIPWHNLFNFTYELHYFFAQKQGESMVCFDPFYHHSDIRLPQTEIFSKAKKIFHVYKIDTKPTKDRLQKEAQTILETHPVLKENLLVKIENCKYCQKSETTFLAKQITAMTNNRLLFRHYLNTTKFNNFMNESFFNKWDAVKIGLYKSTIKKEKTSMVDETGRIFVELIEEEMMMAKTIAAI